MSVHRPKSSLRFVIYRQQMLKLLAYPKPVHDQLVFELPCLMGFRNQEVRTWRAEYINFENGSTFVLDAKKNKLFLVPLSIQVASHVESLLDGRKEGYVIENTSRAWRNRKGPISMQAIWAIWRKYTDKLGLINAHDISPNTGRQFFAAEWFYGQKLSLVTLSQIMRHNDPVTTMRYVAHLIFFEDLRRDHEQFELGLNANYVRQRQPMLETVIKLRT